MFSTSTVSTVPSHARDGSSLHFGNCAEPSVESRRGGSRAARRRGACAEEPGGEKPIVGQAPVVRVYLAALRVEPLEITSAAATRSRPAARRWGILKRYVSVDRVGLSRCATALWPE